MTFISLGVLFHSREVWAEFQYSTSGWNKGNLPLGGCSVTHLSRNKQKCTPSLTTFMRAPDAQSSRHLITGVVWFHRWGVVNKCVSPEVVAVRCYTPHGLPVNDITTLYICTWKTVGIVLPVTKSFLYFHGSSCLLACWLFSTLTASMLSLEHSKRLILPRTWWRDYRKCSTPPYGR